VTQAALGATRTDGPEATNLVLIVGETNPYGADPDYALYHLPERAAGGRLQASIMGVSARHWYLPMWRTNLCTGAWDSGEAKDRAAVLLDSAAPWRTIIMLGKQVMRSFTFHTWQQAMPFTSYASWRRSSNDDIAPDRDRMFTLVALPHPSGRNTIWNTPKAVAQAREVLGEVIPGIPWGSL
jgi:hypothetical protein